MEPRAHVYIMTNGPSGTLYIGVTGNVVARVYQHRSDTGSEFCNTWGLTRLVYVEPHALMDDAIVREKAQEVETGMETQPDREGQSGVAGFVGDDQLFSATLK